MKCHRHLRRKEPSINITIPMKIIQMLLLRIASTLLLSNQSLNVAYGSYISEKYIVVSQK